jgi:predicted dehydrogenase
MDLRPARSWGTAGWQTGLDPRGKHPHNLYTFLSAIVQDREPTPSVADGLAVQRVITAAYASAKKNQWVEVAS